MLSLGTTDRKLALKCCAKLTAQMDRMLDDDLHMTLPEAEVTAFFKAELRRVLRDLRIERTIEHVDGSMTTGKARQNHLNAIILSGMAEDGHQTGQLAAAAWAEMLADVAGGADLEKTAVSVLIKRFFQPRSGPL